MVNLIASNMVNSGENMDCARNLNAVDDNDNVNDTITTTSKFWIRRWFDS